MSEQTHCLAGFPEEGDSFSCRRTRPMPPQTGPGSSTARGAQVQALQLHRSPCGQVKQVTRGPYLRRRPEVIQLVLHPASFLPLPKQALCPRQLLPNSHPTVGANVPSNTVLQIPRYAEKNKSQSQNTNVLSLSTLPRVLFHDLQGGSDCRAPSLSLSELPLSTLFLEPHIPPLTPQHPWRLWKYKVRGRMVWQKAGKEDSEPNWNPKCSRRNLRALNHLKEACSNLLIATPHGCISALRPAEKQAHEGPYPAQHHEQTHSFPSL